MANRIHYKNKGMKTQNEQMIMNGIVAGDPMVLKAFYKNNFSLIRSYIARNSGNTEDAEDVFQDALVLIYQKLKSDSLLINRSIYTYFYGVCKNLWRNRLRRKRKLQLWDTAIIENCHPQEFTVIGDMECKDREHLFWKCFLQLSPCSREILNLFFEGKSAKEIARITGFSEGNVRKKKFDSKKVLLNMMSKHPIYEELKNDQKEMLDVARMAV